MSFLSPKEIADTVVEASKKKASLNFIQLLLLGILAGVYIGFGAELYTMVSHDLSKYLGVGFSKFLGGSVFSVGLMLVVIGGAELFTGNTLMFTGLLSKKINTKGLLRNWSIVYIANFIGSLLLVVIMFYTGLWRTNEYSVGVTAVKIAAAKTSLSPIEAFFRGIGCNWLVCLAVWLAFAGRDIASKILGIYFPIMAFVASGFEHCVANMYFIPMGILLKNSIAPYYIGSLDGLTWSSFILNNLIPVTLGNIIGGAIFVGGIYYYAYQYPKED